MRLSKKNKVVFIVGPTAVGKTRLAVRLAKRVGGEIISCDSMQVYKGMAVLSQAPTAAEKKTARHHLTGILDPSKEYSAAIFRKKATAVIASVVKRKKVPIVAGGSGLYVKALIDGLFPSPEADMKFRRKMEKVVAAKGSAYLHKKMAAIDPDSAEKIHPNDMRRIIRALEIFHSTGKTMTELKAATKGLKDECGVMIFALTAPRETIYDRINSRVEAIVRAGALREVKLLKKKALSMTAGAVLGFKEIAGYLDGEYSLDEAKELLKMNTRRFSKRQLTWFRADPRIKWFDVTKMSEAAIVREIVKSTRAQDTRRKKR